MNQIFVTGRLTRDAELKALPSGQYVLSAGFAIREDMKPETAQTTFVNLVIWGTRAQSLEPYLKKGIFIAVNGRLEVRKNTKDDKTYTDVRINVNQLEFLSSKKDSAAGSGATESSSAATEESEEVPEDEPKATKKGKKSDSDEIPF